jgi:hypothetical protein
MGNSQRKLNVSTYVASTLESNVDKTLLEEIKRKADIVAIIGADIKLKKSGSRHIGLCPFHDDTEPSLNVSAEAQGWVCRACGKKGDVIRWLMLMRGYSFPQSVEMLSGGKIPSEEVVLELKPKENNWVDLMIELTRQLGKVDTLQATKINARRKAQRMTGHDLMLRRQMWSRAHKTLLDVLAIVRTHADAVKALEISPPNLKRFPVYQASISEEALQFVNGSDIFREQLLALCEKET